MSATVALDAAELVIGSFTADGLTYAVSDGVTLVATDASAVVDGAVAVPATVTYDGTTYSVSAIGPYAFYLSGATSAELPASVAAVDDRAFRSSDVERVEVDAGNSELASFDGCLYGSHLNRLLLIPGGRQGAVRIAPSAEEVDASAFSHCAGVDAISVDAGSAAYASWEGLLYDASGTTLLRVPAGATEITIRDGCTAIAAGAMEGCAKLERITAPASVASISPDIFESVPTVSLPAQSAMQDDSQDDSVAGPLAGPGYEGDARSASADSSGAEGEAEASPRRVVASSQGEGAEEAFGSEVPTSPQPPSASSAEGADDVASSLVDQADASTIFAPQLTAMVALTSMEDAVPEVDPSQIAVSLPVEADHEGWHALGLIVEIREDVPEASLAEAGGSRAPGDIVFATLDGGGGSVLRNDGVGVSAIAFVDGAGTIMGSSGSFLQVHYHYPLGTLWIAEAQRRGYTQTGWTGSGITVNASTGSAKMVSGGYYTATWTPNKYSVALDAQGGSVSPASIAATYDRNATLPAPTRTGYKFLGWNTAADGSGKTYQPGTVRNLTTANGATVTLYAQWKVCEIGFDTDSEPGDADYPGVGKDPISADTAGPDGTIEIEDPKRPGYVFEGWVIPTEDGTEAVDQELVYQDEADGKWYVDASKLPDYAGDDGRVELTARWTAALSVDAPISATFMYDLSAWDGTESRDAYVEGSSTVKNRSAVSIRVSGIESKAGDAAGVLKRGDGTTLADAGATDEPKVLSVFPTTSDATGTEVDAKGPATDDAADDLAHRVDLSLSETKLEAAFDHGAWAVDAATVGDNGVTVSTGDLKLGYRLNLGDATGVTLDQDALLAITGEPAGTDASAPAAIANLTYCFAAEGLIPTGAKSDPLWVEVTDPEMGSVGVYGLSDIKRAAEDFSSRVDPATDPNGQDAIYAQLAASPYFELFRQLLDNAVPFHLKVGDNYVDTHVIGFCQDSKSDGTGKAGLTFSYKNVAEQRAMSPTESNAGGWNSTSLRAHLMGNVWPTIGGTDEAGAAFRSDYIEPVMKVWQLYGGSIAGPSAQTLFIPSYFEAFGVQDSYYGIRESKANSFQYMYYAKGGGAANTGGSAYRVKTLDGQPAHWWLRSAVGGIDGSFTHVGASNGSRNSSPANLVVYAGRKYGYTPCFAL